MTHVIKAKVNLENNGDGGRDLIKSESGGMVSKGFPEQTTLFLIPKEHKLASNRVKRVYGPSVRTPR